MNRRGFLKFLGTAAVGATVVYSFPEIIVPKNIETTVFYGKALSYEDLYRAYASAVIGNAEPNFVLCSKAQYDYCDAIFKIMDEDLNDAMKSLDGIVKGSLYGEQDRTMSEIVSLYAPHYSL